MTSPLTAIVHGNHQEVGVTLRGDINSDGDDALAAAYARAAQLDAQVIVLDFNAVDYINSTGIALIVRLLADARRAHRTVRARGTFGPLRGDLPDHPTLGLHDARACVNPDPVELKEALL
jgi:anti-anti-sigma factor